MEKIFHLDSNKSKLEWMKLGNGSYRAFITLGVADLELPYQDSKGNSFTEIITEDQLFNDDSLKTAYGLPITLNHPKLGVFEQNTDGLQIGCTLESFLKQDKTLLMPASITDKRGIQLIDSILMNQDSNENLYAEISPGYWAYKFFNKDTKKIEQQNRVYDHVALLPVGAGRGGQKIVLRTDSIISTTLENSTIVETFEDDYSIETCTKEEICMTTRKIEFKNQTYDLPLAVADYMEDSIQKLPKISKELAEANGKLAAMQISLDAKNEMITLDQASQIIKESIALWQIVEPVFKADSKDFQPDYSLNPTQIKELYLKKFHPTVQCDSADFINGAWSVIAPGIANQTKSTAKDKVQAQLDSLKSGVETITTDSYEDEIAKARKEMEDRISKNNK